MLGHSVLPSFLCASFGIAYRKQNGSDALEREKPLTCQNRLLTFIVDKRPGKACFRQSELNHIIFSLQAVPAGE